MGNILSFEGANDRHKRHLDETIKELQRRLDEGVLEELVVATCTKDSEVELYVAAHDYLGAVGIITVAKDILLHTEKG